MYDPLFISGVLSLPLIKDHFLVKIVLNISLKCLRGHVNAYNR